MQVRVSPLLHFLWQILNVLVNCVNHLPYPQPPRKLQATHARPPHSQAPSPAFLSSCREIIKCYSHVVASASLSLSPAWALALVAAAADFPVASETNLHRQRWFSSGLLCLRFPRWTPTRLCHYPSSIAPLTQAGLWGCHLPLAGLLLRETTDLQLTTDRIKTLQGMATQDYRVTR